MYRTVRKPHRVLAVAITTVALAGVTALPAQAAEVDCSDPDAVAAQVAEARAASNEARSFFQDLARARHRDDALRTQMRDARAALKDARRDLAAARKGGQGDVDAAKAAVADAVAAVKEARGDLANPKEARREAKKAWDEAKAAWQDLKQAADACEDVEEPPTEEPPAETP